jgi:HAD superfamily hydrolase (TIGR01549 family)
MKSTGQKDRKLTTAVLFDLEGTLVQTPWENPQHVSEFRTRTRRKLIELDIPSPILRGIERSTLMRNKASEYVERHLSEAEAQRFHREMDGFLRRYEVDAATNSRLFTDTVPTLEELKKRRVKMGLVTNTSLEAVQIAFRLHSLDGYFDAIITREHVKRLKPEPEGILLALRRLGADDFLMVGDLKIDVLAAKKADGHSVFVNRRRHWANNVDPDYVVRSLRSVPPILFNRPS